MPVSSLLVVYAKQHGIPVVAHSSLFLSAEDRFEWMLLGVYGPNDHRDNEIYGLRLK